MNAERTERTADEESPLLDPASQPSQQHPHLPERQDESQLRAMANLATLAAIYGGTAVALGAFGAHGLKKRIADPARIQNWGTAAHVCEFLSLPSPSLFPAAASATLRRPSRLHSVTYL